MEKRSPVVEEESIAVADTGLEETTGKAPTSPSDRNNLSKKIEEDQLNSTRAEVGEAKEENERLKKVLTRIVKDYQTLQMHFFDIVQQEGTKPPAELISSSKANEPIDVEEPELVSLRLGMSATDMYKKEEKVASKEVEEGLTLGLDSKFESSEEEPGEPWPPSKIAKSSRSGDEELLPQAQVKRARVSVRARCDTPTMNDGCQWRKYGQKVSKGNPCPRAYYRCTVAPLCPVRKQVQRCADDMSILITTYEGTHNHPLPVTATAMASTTSAAACMLTSGSSTTNRLSASSSISYSNNFATADHSHLISPPNSQPTITLDLTNRYPSHVQQRYAPVTTSTPTSFSFSNQDYRTNLYSGLNQSYWQRAAATSALPPPPPMLGTDTIARAITADPSFQSALAAAITSYVGARGEGTGGYLARTGSLGSGRQQVVVSDTKSVSGSPVDEMERAK